VLQFVAVRCRVLQCVAECCSALQCVAVCYNGSMAAVELEEGVQCVAMCCSVLQCDAVYSTVLQRLLLNSRYAVCCRVVQSVAVT